MDTRLETARRTPAAHRACTNHLANNPSRVPTVEEEVSAVQRGRVLSGLGVAWSAGRVPAEVYFAAVRGRALAVASRAVRAALGRPVAGGRRAGR
jgi:hypothetical protein